MYKRHISLASDQLRKTKSSELRRENALLSFCLQTRNARGGV